MNIAEWLSGTVGSLEKVEIASARLDAELLLAYVLKKDRSYLLAHPEEFIQEGSLHELNNQIERRKNGEPIAYITGVKEFYGREFVVNKSVLVPRPESENMIDVLKEQADHFNLMRGSSLIIADVGTGSGCLAVTAKLEFPEATVLASDIDKDCLKVASQNAKRLKANVSFFEGDLIEPLRSELQAAGTSIVLANLPYVPNHMSSKLDLKAEPKVALFGGSDGLDLYRRFASQLKSIAKKPFLVIVEALPQQHGEIISMFGAVGYSPTNTGELIVCMQLEDS